MEGRPVAVAVLTGPGGVLVGTDDRGVDRDDTVEVALGVAWASRPAKTRSHVPSIAQNRSLLQAAVHDPKCSGKSSHGVPVRYLNAIASITCR